MELVFEWSVSGKQMEITKMVGQVYILQHVISSKN